MPDLAAAGDSIEGLVEAKTRDADTVLLVAPLEDPILDSIAQLIIRDPKEHVVVFDLVRGFRIGILYVFVFFSEKNSRASLSSYSSNLRRRSGVNSVARGIPACLEKPAPRTKTRLESIDIPPLQEQAPPVAQ